MARPERGAGSGDGTGTGNERETEPARRDSGSDRRFATRRELLTALGGASAVSALAPGPTTATVDAPPVRVRIYPGPVPLHGWVRSGAAGMHRDWPRPYRDALAAVETTLERVLTYANRQSRLEGLALTVERGEPVRFPLADAPMSSEAVAPSLPTVLETFGEQLRKRDALAARTCHVLFCWSPLNYRVGYGGTLSPNAQVGSSGNADEAGETSASDGGTIDPVDGALTVANLGATEIWDSRAVTRNMAIHEVLHTFLTDEAVGAVGGTACDHDLGAAVQVDDEHTRRVTPLATAYAGPDRIGGGTRFHGRGCYDHAEFHRHDGTDGVTNWTYTTEPSDATLEAVTRTLEREVVGQ